MLGAFAGQVIKAGSAYRRHTALRRAVIAVVLLLLGYVHSMHTPVNKHLWTTSMTLISGGWCWALMALFYWLIDVNGWSRGLAWLKIYGNCLIIFFILWAMYKARVFVKI